MSEKNTKNIEKINKSTEVTVSELAVVLDLSANRIYQMTTDGILQRTGRGRFLLADSVGRYIDFRTKEPVTEDEQQLEKAKQEAEVRIKQAKARVAELEVDELEGKLHRSEDVASMTEDLIYTIRGALLALPGRLAMDVKQAESSAAAADVIRAEVYKLMDELSGYQYDPQKYAERVRERMKWEVESGGDGDDGE